MGEILLCGERRNRPVNLGSKKIKTLMVIVMSTTESFMEEFPKNPLGLYACATLWLGVLGALIFFTMDLWVWNLEGSPAFIPSIIASVIFIASIRHYTKLPKKLQITNVGFFVDGIQYKWEKLNAIAYTRDTGKMPFKKINLLTEERTVSIYPSAFTNGDSIGMYLSQIASKYGIKIVLDRW